MRLKQKNFKNNKYSKLILSLKFLSLFKKVNRKGLLLGKFPFYKDSSMQKSHNFSGKILFSPQAKSKKLTLMTYQTEPLEAGFEQTMMSSFYFLKFSTEEKKQLSTRHRRVLNNYRQISPFALNLAANELIQHISKCKSSTLVIEAHDYGAYICLAALYSGKLPSNKKIEFHFEGSPLALFPKSLLNKSHKNQEHKIVFRVCEDSWLTPFSTLYSNDKIKCFYLKAA